MSERLRSPTVPLARSGPAVGRTGQPLTLLAREVEVLEVHFNFDPDHPDQPAGYEPPGGRPAPAPGEPNHNVQRRGRTELVRQSMAWNNGLRCLYHNADRAYAMSGQTVSDLDGWGRGHRITEPEWTRERSLPLCFVHGCAVWVRAKLGRRRAPGRELQGRLLAESSLAGRGESSLGTGSASFSIEACAVTQSGRLLPGGYAPTSCETGRRGATGFTRNRGFRSAFELIRWWSATNRGDFARFMCWAAVDTGSGATAAVHYWDRNGQYYDYYHRNQIYERGLDLLPP